MSGQLLDLVKTEPLSDPVAQARSSQIMERASFDTGQAPDLVEVMAELRQGRPAFLDTPLPGTATFLDTLIGSHRNKDVRISFRLRHLVFYQQLHHLGGQRKRSAFSILDVSLPRASAIFGQLEPPFQLLDLLRSSARREVPRQTVLNESLTVLITDVLHIDVAHALDEISHRPRCVIKSSGSHLPLRTHEAILEEVREPHRYWPGDVHP